MILRGNYPDWLQVLRLQPEYAWHGRDVAPSDYSSHFPPLDKFSLG